MGHSWSENRILTHYQAAKTLYRAQTDDSIVFPPPRFLSIWISEVCNLDCTYCYFSSTNSDRGRTFIPTDPMLKWLREMKDFGAEALEFSGGGEPTVNKDFPVFLEETKNMGYELGLITHACNDMPLELMAKNLHYVRCGLDAASVEMHDRIKQNRKKNYWFPRALENIRELVRLRDVSDSKTFTVGMKCVLNTINISELVEMIDLAEELKVNYIQIKSEHSSDHPLTDAQKEEGQAYINMKAMDAGFTKVLGNLYHQNATTKCFMSPVHTVVTAMGQILQCCFFEDRPIGTIFEPLKEVWGGPKHRQVMKNTLVEECDNIDCRWNFFNTKMKEVIEDPLAQASFI